MSACVPEQESKERPYLFVQDDVVGVSIELFVRELVGLVVLDLLDG